MQQYMKDVTEWDVRNWSRAIETMYSMLVNQSAGDNSKEESPIVLDIGGRNGGLSLFFAKKGYKCICSDINDDCFEKAKNLHKKYHVEDNVKYEVVNGLDIQYENHFDIITFKSVLGGIGSNDNYENQVVAINQMYKALKPGGYLVFCENLIGSRVLQFMRKKIRKWGNIWRYTSIEEITDLLSGFENVEYNSFGRLGVYGRTRFLNMVLSSIDRVCDKYMKDNNNYIIAVCARKQLNP